MRGVDAVRAGAEDVLESLKLFLGEQRRADQHGCALSVTDGLPLVHPVAHQCRGAKDFAQAPCCPAKSPEVVSVAPSTCGTSLESGVAVAWHQDARGFEFVSNGDQGQSRVDVVHDRADNGDGLRVGSETPSDAGGVWCLLVPEWNQTAAVSTCGAQYFVGAGETSGNGASLLLRGVGQVHAAADSVAVGLRCDHKRLTFLGHPEDECRRALLAPLDQLGHVGHRSYGAIHMRAHDGFVFVRALQPGRQ